MASDIMNFSPVKAASQLQELLGADTEKTLVKIYPYFQRLYETFVVPNKHQEYGSLEKQWESLVIVINTLQKELEKDFDSIFRVHYFFLRNVVYLDKDMHDAIFAIKQIRRTLELCSSSLQ